MKTKILKRCKSWKDSKCMLQPYVVQVEMSFSISLMHLMPTLGGLYFILMSEKMQFVCWGMLQVKDGALISAAQKGVAVDINAILMKGPDIETKDGHVSTTRLHQVSLPNLCNMYNSVLSAIIRLPFPWLFE